MDARGRKSQRRLSHAAAVGTAITPATAGSKSADDQDARDKRTYFSFELTKEMSCVTHGGSRECLLLAPRPSHYLPRRKVARLTFDAGPMLTLVEFCVGELCPNHAPESGIVHHPFWGYSTVRDPLVLWIQQACRQR
jgi:hypothetical protein